MAVYRFRKCIKKKITQIQRRCEAYTSNSNRSRYIVTVIKKLYNYHVHRLYNGKAAENELKQISSDQHTFGQDLVKHNLVVFKNGEGALKVFFFIRRSEL